MYIWVRNTAFYKLLCRHYYDDDRQATRQTIASVLLDLPSLPFCLPIPGDQRHQNYRSTVGAFGQLLVLRLIVHQRHGCEANLSHLLQDGWSPIEFNTRLCLLQRPHVHMVFVVFVVAASRSQEAAVALEYLPFLYGWKPTVDHWECPTPTNSGSATNAIRFLQHRVECQARYPMIYKSISL